jgi:hypothetical protein
LPPRGGIAPMAFETYEETLPFAGAIRRVTREKSMPPWFADSDVGRFLNDPSLRPAEIAHWGKKGCTAVTALGGKLEHPETSLGLEDVAGCDASGERRYRVHL